MRRNFRNNFLLLFDQAATSSTFGRRDVSNVPTQALALLNDPFVVEQAATWGGRMATLDLTPERRVTLMFREAFARTPVKDEIAAALRLVGERTEGWNELALALINTKEFIYVR